MSLIDHTFTCIQFGSADYLMIKIPDQYKITVDDYNSFHQQLKSVSMNNIHADIPHLDIHYSDQETTKDFPSLIDLAKCLIFRFSQNGWVGNLFLIWSLIARLPSIDYFWVKKAEYLVTDKARFYLITM